MLKRRGKKKKGERHLLILLLSSIVWFLPRSLKEHGCVPMPTLTPKPHKRGTAEAPSRGPAEDVKQHNRQPPSNTVPALAASPGPGLTCSGWAPRSFHREALGWQPADFGKQLKIGAEAQPPE